MRTTRRTNKNTNKNQLHHNPPTPNQNTHTHTPTKPIHNEQPLRKTMNKITREQTRNSNTPANILKQITNDDREDLKKRVAAHPNTPTETLTQLAADKSKYVRYNVAKNPNTNNETLTQLVTDTDWEVRVDTTNNPNTPLAILKTLTTDKNHFVREGVQRRRQTNINNCIKTLKGKQKTQALLLAPTFTGWEDELTETIKTYNKHQQSKTGQSSNKKTKRKEKIWDCL